MRCIKLSARLLTFLFAVLVAQTVYGLDERYGAPPLRGNQVATDSSNLVKDTVWFNPALKPQQTTFLVKDIITFKLDESYTGVLPDSFRVRITFDLNYIYDNGGPANGTTPNVILTLTYSKNNPYNHKAVFAQLGLYQVQVVIKSVVAEYGTLNDFRPALMLTNEIEVNREYGFSCTNNAIQTISGSTTPVATKGELKVNWQPQRAADEYDLEWTWIDGSALANYYKTGTTNYDPKKIFTRNASRVSIQKEEYYIPLLYEGSGSLFYRVRAVQVKRNGQRMESLWSSDYANGLGKYDFTGLDTMFNWQSSTSFAEDGKRKSVVQYFDGSLKSRQTQTKDNTTDTTLIAETFYDNQGRPVIQVMPTPSLSSLIKYTPNFNKLNGAEYDKGDYDGFWNDTCYCNEAAPGMDSISGAAKYYSANNPLVNTSFHQYIPKAKGFVFAETRYTPDNTGRISKQGGVGEEFRLGKGHDTKYTYNGADQEELDALFGTEAGNASHYFKNTVQDANGQTSVSYVDMHGRTVATALAGSTPGVKVDLLSSNTPYLITKKLLDSNTNVIKGMVIESSKGLVITKSDSNRFVYSLLPDSISIKNCSNNDICYDCIYDLEIRITDECNNIDPIVITRTNYHLDTLCNALQNFPMLVDTTVFLPEGSYLISKTLTINNKALEYYRDSIFMVKNTCRTLAQSIQEQKQLLQSKLSCIPLTCDACKAGLTNVDDFRTAYMQQSGISFSDSAIYQQQVLLAFNNKIAECNALCGESMDKQLRKQMLADLTPPYGQYANRDKITPYSIFSTTNPYSAVSGFKDENGLLDPLNPQNLPIDQFIAQFKSSWAETLLPLHPEYHKLQKYEQLAASNEWDIRFGNTDTYQAAVDSGFLNPGAFAPPRNGQPFTYNAAHRDPFFTDYVSGGIVPFQYWLEMNGKLRNKNNDFGTFPDSVSAWSLATLMAHCPGMDDDCTNQWFTNETAFTMGSECSGEFDMAWRFFREMYLQDKREMVDKVLTNYHNQQNGTNLNLVRSHYHFLNFPFPYDLSQGPQNEFDVTDSLNLYIADNCAAYVQQWWNELQPCGIQPSDTAELFDRLKAVCREGGDADHVFGSSTVKPGSGNEFASFEAVLKDFCQSKGITYGTGCNVYLITAPKPYDQQPVYYDKPVYQKPTDCECETINTLYQRYQSAGTDTSFAAYLYRTTGTRMHQGVLDTLRMACNGEINCNYLKEELTLPPALQCGVKDVCVDCIRIDTLYRNYLAEFPNAVPQFDNIDSLQQERNKLFERYMNTQLGFSKSAVEYLTFMDTCGHATKYPANWWSGIDTSKTDTAHFYATDPCYYTQKSDYNGIFANGMAHIPDSVYAGCSGIYSTIFFKKDTLCVGNEFSVSMRIKHPRAEGQVWSWDVIPELLTDINFLNAGFMQMGPPYENDTAASQGWTSVNLYNPSFQLIASQGNIKGMVRSFDDWAIVTFTASNNVYKVYFNDTLVAQLPYTGTISKLYRMGVSYKGKKGAYVDWFKVYDRFGVLQYVEEFEDAKPSATNYPLAFTCYTQSSDSVGTVLRGLRDEFVNNYFNFGRKYDSFGCDTVSWKFNFGGWINSTGIPHKDIVNNGILQFPDTLSTSYGHRRLDYDFYLPHIPSIPNPGHDSACIDGYVNIEIRMKDTLASWETVHMNHFTFYFGPVVSNQIIVALDRFNVWNYVHSGGLGLDSVVRFNSEFQQNYNGWHTFNFEVDNNNFTIYYDGQLIKSFTFKNIPKDKFYGYSLTSTVDSNLSTAYDYVKCYDRNGNVFYFEDFNDCGGFQQFAPYIRCPKQPCTQSFTQYYNAQQQTSYTYSQIDSLYDSYNIPLTICGSSDSSDCTFQKTYGGSGTDVVYDMYKTTDAGYIMAGYTNSFGNGGLDGYVIKTDSKGNLLWSKTYGGSNEDLFYKIRPTFDGGYIAAGSTRSFHQTQREVFVVKMDAQGNVDWSKGFNQGTTNGELAYDIIQTSDSGYAIHGMYNYAPGLSDFQVIRLSSSGNVLWAKRFGSNGSDDGGAITEDNDTLVVTAAVLASSVGNPDTYYDGLLLKINKNNGNIIWSKTYNVDAPYTSRFSRIYPTAAGYDIMNVGADQFGSEHVRTSVVTVNKNGNVIRIKRIQTPGGSADGLSIDPTPDGGYIATQSEFTGPSDVYWHKTDAIGNLQWTNRVKRTGNQYIRSSVALNDGSYVGAGTDAGDALLMKVNSMGKSNCDDTSLHFTNSNLTYVEYNTTLSVNTTLTFSNNDISVTAIDAPTSVNTTCDGCFVQKGPLLCGKTEPVFAPVFPPPYTPCADSTLLAAPTGMLLHEYYTDSLKGSFSDRYLAKCLNVRYSEQLTVYQPVSEYHYTLYYYDQAGNLIKTIPPQGVDISKFGHARAWSDSVTTARRNKQLLTPKHTLPTQYRYNTLNQVVASQSPDGGLAEFWYDRLGRLAISRNAKQKANSTTENNRLYSYTKYDPLGRIFEVGQASNLTGNPAVSDAITRNETSLSNWFTAVNTRRSQITTTMYDLEAGLTDPALQMVQRNLRNRVSYTYIADTGNISLYRQATFYTYDILGNVDTLLQDYGTSGGASVQNVMNQNNNRFKKIVYKYDLISGKVNMVMYQRGWADGFYHRYSYDAENRLTLVETSPDDVVWEKEARYDYYRHGPLARVTLGDQQVQGIDYAYTLQGWLKGINSTGGTTTHDIGGDGKVGGLNQYTAADAIGLTLNYFTVDYAAINNGVTPFPGYSGALDTAYRPLYNGNISSMSVYQKKFEGSAPGGPLIFYNYKYDQLNRLVRQDAFNGFSNNAWSLNSMGEKLKERIAYDANGNILKYLRKSLNGTTADMDSLSYEYYTGTNQLRRVMDSVSANTYTSYENNKVADIDDQPVNNYAYDAIGNLIKDSAEKITSIKWNVYGKIQEITRTATVAVPANWITYRYDALGNRISQVVQVQPPGGSLNRYYTWYVRDAQGNILSTYTAEGTGTLDTLDLKQDARYIYGSSRIGSYNLVQSVNNGPASYMGYSGGTFVRGIKSYELTNHLGNVLAVISDKKIGVPSAGNSSLIDHYEPEIVSATDYYPFGMPSRVAFSGKGYRFGFNGKENDNDVKGYGSQQDYGMRIYDPRVGRFLSVDPLTKQYPWLSPYQYAENSPIANVDLDGLESSYAADGRVVNGPWAKDPLTGGRLYGAPLPNTFAYVLDQSKKVAQKPAAQPIAMKQDALRIPAQVRTIASKAQSGLDAKMKAIEEHWKKYGNDYSVPMSGVITPQATIDKPKPNEGYSPFEYGMITSPATQASVMVVCPGCAVTYGGAQTYSGITTGNYWEAGAGVLNMIGGGVGLYAKFAPTPAGTKLAQIEAESGSGSHFLSRHGAQTSLSSQYKRAISGLTPEGEVLGEVNSTRFLSDNLQLQAVTKAKAEFAASGKTSFTMDMGKIIGEGYLKGGGTNSYRMATQVQAVFKNGDLITLYPLIKK